jgi:hypothetical protein
MASLMNLARESAIMTRQQHLIKIDTQDKYYRMFLFDPEEKTSKPIEGKWGRKFNIYIQEF